MLLRVINQLSLSYLRRPTLHRSKNIVSLYELELTVLYLQTFVHLYHARQTDSSSSHVTGHAKICESSCQPIGYTLSNPKRFQRNNTNTKKLPLPENHGNLQKKPWLYAVVLWGLPSVGHHPSAEPTAMPLNILAMASRLVGRYTANLALGSQAGPGRWLGEWESWWKHVMFTTHDWEW